MVNIKLQNIVAKVNGKTVLDNVTFSVSDGEYIGLLGPSGSGPSDTLKIIAGILPITSGKLIIDDVDVTNVPPEDRDTGFVFEQFNLFPHMTVMDNILFGPKMKRMDLKTKRAEALEILKMVRLDGRENAMPRELSGGMQQRVGIARAVVASTKMLLLDQPYRALDAKIREEMRYEIREIVKELNLTALHSTHETEEAMMIADRIAVFRDGKLQQIGEPEEIFQMPSNEFVASFLAESNSFKGRISDGVIDIGQMQLKTVSHVEGEVNVVIRQHAVELAYDGDLENNDNIFNGIITKIRVLGEFIRFNVMLENGIEIISRQLLDLKWRNPTKFIDKSVIIGIAPTDVKVFLQDQK